MKSALEVVLGVMLECARVKFENNFMICKLDNFKAILVNIFLDTYKVGIWEGLLVENHS